VTEYSWQATSCDPCPTPPLEDQDLATLGADVIPSNQGEESGVSSYDFVVTRLHARYGRDSLGDDLHFRAAHAIVGGREMGDDPTHLEQTARPDEMNNFQARYVIRHRWTGPIACANPQRGIWGGPPGGGEPQPPPAPAMNLAFAARDVNLASFVRGPAPEGVIIGAAGPTPLMKLPPSGGGCAGCTAAPKSGDIASAGVFIALFFVITRRMRRRGKEDT
jgi:hypothetical protein